MHEASSRIPDESIEMQRLIDSLCDEFEDGLKAGGRPEIEQFLGRIQPDHQPALLAELLPLELDARAHLGEQTTIDAYLQRLPRFEEVVRREFADRNPPLPIQKLLDSIVQAGLLDSQLVRRLLNEVDPETAGNAARFSRWLVDAELLTDYQRQSVVDGKSDPVVLGDYIILDRLGSGGMGQVYKARHRRMERLVAIKTLPDELAGDPDALSRFHREAKAAARLSHPNVVTAYDAREDGGIHYLVMEYVPGEDLSKHIKEHGPMTPSIAAECILQAAKGLEYAHRKGVIHRDVKPNNLLLERREDRTERTEASAGIPISPSTRGPRPTVKVLDMGLARLEHPDGDPSHSISELTHSGAVMGTVDYMAPEQAQNTHSADHRSDIYGLGITLFYLLTGKTAYGGKTVMERLLAHREQPIPSLESTLKTLHPVSGADTELSVMNWKGLDDVFRKMVAKKPSERYQSMSQVIADLEPLTVSMGADEQTFKIHRDSESRGGSGSQVGTAKPLDSRRLRPAATSIKTLPSIANAEDTLHDVARERTVKMAGERPPTAPQKRGNNLKWIALSLVLIGVAAASTMVYRILTDHGTIVVEIEDESVVAQLTAAGLEVFDRNDPNKKWTINLAETGEAATEGVPSGDYEVPVIPGVELHITDGDGAEYTGSEFKLTRGEEVRIRISAEAPGVASPPDYVQEREVAEWILSIGGTVTVVVAGEANRLVTALPLPEQSFHVVTIGLAANLDVSNRDLLRLEPLSSLEDIDLSYCPQIGDEGVAALGQIPSLTKINLAFSGVRDAKMTDQGLRHLAGCVHLEYLEISSLPVTIQGMRALRHLPLQDLVVELTPLRYSELPEIVAIFPGLRRYHGYRLQGDVGEGLSPLAQLPNLERLAVSADFVTAGPPHHLDRFPRLCQLELYHVPFPAGLAPRLEQFPRVTGLILKEPTFEDEAFAELCANTTLEQLELISWVSDAELLQLTAMPKLRVIVLQQTQVTAAGAQAFHEQRPDVTISGDFNIPGETVASEPDYAQEREVAEWVLSIGGTVRVNVAGEANRIVSELPLPEQSFEVVVIDLGANANVSNADLMRLQSLSSLEHINLQRCPQISDEGVAALGQIPSLKKISLALSGVRDAKVTDQGLVHLAGCVNLESLDLSSLPVTIQGLRALRPLPLWELVINKTQLRYSELPEIVALFPGLQRFDGYLLQGDVGEGLSPLAQLPNLEYLAVIPDLVTAGPPHHLDQFPQLRQLEMYHLPFPAGLASRLEQLPRVTELVLKEPAFGDEAFAELCANTTLEELELISWGGDAELLQLSAMPKLRLIVLRQTQVTAAGAQAFHEARPDVAITGDFDIPASTTPSAAAEWTPTPDQQAFFDEVAALPPAEQVEAVRQKLIDVNPDFNGQLEHAIDADGVVRLQVDVAQISDIWPIRALGHVQSLRLIGNAAEDGAFRDLSPLAGMAVSDLLLSYCAVVDLAPLAHLPLQSVQVFSQELNDESLSALSTLSQLRTIRVVGYGQLTDATLAHLAGLSQLEYIQVDADNMSDAGLAHLHELSALRALHVRGPEITDAGILALPQFDRLEELHMTDTAVTDELLEALEGHRSLGGLSVEGAAVSDEGLRRLASIPNLRNLSLVDTDVTGEALADFENSQLWNLALRAPAVSDTAMTYVGRMRTLKHLRVSSEQITDAGLAQLHGLALLEYIELGGTSVTADGVNALHAAIPGCRIVWDGGVIEPVETNADANSQ